LVDSIAISSILISSKQLIEAVDWTKSKEKAEFLKLFVDVMVLSQMDYYIRANHSINGKGKLQYLTKLFIL